MNVQRPVPSTGMKSQMPPAPQAGVGPASSVGSSYPDVSQIPEAQGPEDGAVGEKPAGTGITSALRTLQTFALAQEQKGNPSIKQAFIQFIQQLAGGLGAGPEAPGGAAPGMEGNMQAEAPNMPEDMKEMPQGQMAFNPFEAQKPMSRNRPQRMSGETSNAVPMI